MASMRSKLAVLPMANRGCGELSCLRLNQFHQGEIRCSKSHYSHVWKPNPEKKTRLPSSWKLDWPSPIKKSQRQYGSRYVWGPRRSAYSTPSPTRSEERRVGEE